MLLEIVDLVARYGAVEALHGVSLVVAEGEIVSLLGANGAGKSTTLKAISRVIAPSSGSITFAGKPLDGLQPEDVVALGIAHVPEGRRIFPGLSVIDNLRLGATARRASRAEIDSNVDEALAVFPKLRGLAGKLGWTLSGGEQQMLAIARGLMAKPRLLLLDEPSLGLAPLIVTDVMETIVRIARGGTTVLLVEQNAHLALQIASRAYVLETGRVALSGAAATLLASEEMRRAYLGSAVRV
jgi:branched-chain amino acid transport system ATP-binding protein